MKIQIQKIGITNIEADCIVNAANTGLWDGDGVCGAIFQAAGYNELRAACKQIGFCEEGSAVITPGFNSKAKYIIHAVGPRWKDGYQGEPHKLYTCYQAAMRLAEENGCKTIAFPLISAGIYSYPVEGAWKGAINAVYDYLNDHPECGISVTFTVIKQEIYDLGQKILKAKIGKASGNIIFFWHEYETPYGCFSQWYRAPFTIEGITYFCCEQYMMAKKALLFEDYKHYCLIMAADTPQKCKAYGKAVRNFDAIKWDAAKEEIVFNANMAKFTQNPQLKSVLLSTVDAMLAEASPYDDVWGIKMEASDIGADNPKNWKGQNLLGKCLQKVRSLVK